MLKNALGLEGKTLQEIQGADSVCRHKAYGSCGGFNFLFRLSEIKYKLGSSRSPKQGKDTTGRDAKKKNQHAI